MANRSSNSRRLIALALIALLVPFAATGCKKKRSHHHPPSKPYSEFYWDASVISYTGVEEYEWYNPYSDAIVEFDALDFWGTFTVEIYDDHDHLIFVRTYFGDGHDEFEKDLTGIGDPGYWWIVLRSSAAHGELQLILD